MGMAAEATDATIGPSRRGLRRGTLTRDMILAESLRLLDEDGVEGFSLPKLGRALGADQTAVYRHFASKDDIVLALADKLIEEAMSGFGPRKCWVDTLIEMAHRLRRTYLAHPAAASISAYRTTQGPAEIRTVDIIIGAMLSAGFEGAEAALMYRAVGDFALSWAGFEASFRALDDRLQQNDSDARRRAYLAVSRDAYPNIWQIRTELPEGRRRRHLRDDPFPGHRWPRSARPAPVRLREARLTAVLPAGPPDQPGPVRGLPRYAGARSHNMQDERAGRAEGTPWLRQQNGWESRRITRSGSRRSPTAPTRRRTTRRFFASAWRSAIASST